MIHIFARSAFHFNPYIKKTIYIYYKNDWTTTKIVPSVIVFPLVFIYAKIPKNKAIMQQKTSSNKKQLLNDYCIPLSR